MNIYIELEVLNREFKSRLLVACFAAVKGFNVYLLHRSQIYESGLNGHISPGLVFMKDANSTYYVFKKIEKLKKLGFKFVSQDEESGIQFEDFDDFIKRRFADGKTFRLLEYYFCWGQRDKKNLDKKFYKFTDFINTGSPRFDLLRKNLFNNQSKKNFFLKYNIKNK